MPRAGPTHRSGSLGSWVHPAALAALALLLGGCDVWDRFVSRFVLGLALFFLALLLPLAVGGAVGWVAGLQRAPSGVAAGGAWALAVTASFFAGFAGQLLEVFLDHMLWAVVLPLLGIPATGWALTETGRLLCARGQPAWVWWGVGAAGAGYLVWLGTMIVPHFT